MEDNHFSDIFILKMVLFKNVFQNQSWSFFPNKKWVGKEYFQLSQSTIPLICILRHKFSLQVILGPAGRAGGGAGQGRGRAGGRAGPQRDACAPSFPGDHQRGCLPTKATSYCLSAASPLKFKNIVSGLNSFSGLFLKAPSSRRLEGRVR